MTWWFLALLVGNVVVALLLVTLLATYMIRYYFWRRPEGRIVVASLFCMLSVITAGLFERAGMIGVHNVLAAVGYWGASVVLLLALRHIWKLTNAEEKAVEHRDVYEQPPAEP
jgi:hypothetical protein